MSAYEQSSTSGGGHEDLKERAKDSVAEVDAGAKHVAGVAGEEAGNVAHEAKSAAKGFFYETRVQLSEQASTQQRRAAEAVRSTADDLVGMADGRSPSGPAAGIVRNLGNQTHQIASWLDQREPADLVREVRGFARRHTGAFLVAAVGLGIVAGRLTRAMMPSGDSGSTGASGTTGARMTGATGVAPATGMGTGTAMPATGMGTGMPATGVGTGEAPIGDALAADPLGTQSGTNAVGNRDALVDGGETASGEWSPSGEAQR